MKYPFLGPLGQRSADLLGLSMAGALKIAPYDEHTHAISFDSYISSPIVKKHEVKDALRFYIHLCNDHCKNNYLDPDFSVINKVAMQYNIDGSGPIYLPENERVKVAMPVEETFKKKGNQQQNTNPYNRKPLPSSLLLSKSKFEFSPKDYSKLDHIADAIKLVGYVSAGIHGPINLSLNTIESFMADAQLKISDMIFKGEKYTLDLPTIISEMDTFIEWTIEKHSYHPYIQAISSPEDAKQQAHQAIAEFIPKILKPFSHVNA